MTESLVTPLSAEPGASSAEPVVPSSAEWFGIPAAQLGDWWPLAIPHIERVLARGNAMMTLDDVREFVASELMQLWVLWDDRQAKVRGAGVTEICIYPRAKTCICRLFSADDDMRAQWLPKLGVIEEWAKAKGCDAVEVIGRPGWRRILPGYRQCHVTLRKDLGRKDLREARD